MNCIIIDDDELSRKTTEFMIKKTGSLALLNSFSDPVGALSYMANNKPDLVFLDVEMPEMTGMEFIDIIKHDPPQIILTTSHEKFARTAFDFNVTDYLLKPFTFQRFYAAVMKASTLFNKQSANQAHGDFLFVKKGNSILKIMKSDILWIEALGDYLTINTHGQKIIVHSTMHAMFNKLSAEDYMRVHRSFIVRIDQIESIEDNAISFHDKIIPIGKSYKEDVMNRLNLL
ncbi:MAG: LytR/AlgR family response regulator transcription factor [Bacteroidia bacterium]